SLALGAPRWPLDRDLPLGAEHRVAQVHLDGCLDVVPSQRLPGASARRPLAALAEQVAEHRAEVAQIRGIEAAAGESLEPPESAPPPSARRRPPAFAAPPRRSRSGRHRAWRRGLSRPGVP